MKKTFRFSLLASLLMLAVFAVGQAVPLQTSLSSAVATSTQTTVYPASVTNFAVGNLLYVDNEVMAIKAINTSAVSVTVTRGQSGTAAAPHASGTMVLVGVGAVFQTYDPSGYCTAATTIAQPLINVRNGNQWLCSSVSNTWVPGFNNSGADSPTAAVASAAGVILPSGPLFHVTGALAITGFTVPVGFSKGNICVIPDGTFTTTTAGNIALASTAVVSKVNCWSYDPNTAKFYPSY